jgi:putative oxidoreductase
MISKLAQTNTSISPVVIRIFLGLVMLPHGLQKTLGMFGGYGFSGTMDAFTQKLGLPAAVAFLVIMAESLGALSIILGFMTRFCAASLAVVMIGAVHMAHWDNGFFMNWFGQQAGEGFEYHLLVIGMCVALVFSGAGTLSVDRLLSKKE